MAKGYLLKVRYVVLMIVGCLSVLAIRGTGAVGNLARADSLSSRDLPCRNSNLRMSPIHSAVAAGTIAITFSLRDTSRQRCALQGWPTVTARTAGGALTTASRTSDAQIGVDSHRGREVILTPGSANAAFILRGSDTPRDGQSCGPSYRSVAVSLPDDTGQLAGSAFVPGLGRFMPSCAGLDVSRIVTRTELGGLK